MKYVKGLDTIRALAVFFVIADHWGPDFQEHTIPYIFKSIFIQKGEFGVNMFFVLSGFLITSILLNEKVKNTGGKHLSIIKNFFVRRILRIFPIYYLVILLCYMFNYRFVHEHIGNFLTYTSNLLPYRTGQANVLSHTWSLAVEEQFYIVWPWLIILINKKYIKHILWLAIAIGIVSKYIVLYVLHHTYPVLVFNCFDAFGIGGLYAYIRLNKDTCKEYEKRFLVALPFLLFIAWRMAPFSGIPAFVIFSHELDSLVALAFIMFALNNKWEWMRKYILENNAFNFIGRISYGIYLYHFTFGPAFDSFMHSILDHNTSLPSFLSSFYFIYVMKLVALITICWLSFIIIEKPILRLKKKFEYSS